MGKRNGLANGFFICLVAGMASWSSGCAVHPARMPWQFYHDHVTQAKVKKALAAVHAPKTIQISTFDYYVRLSGYVDSSQEKTRAVEAARKVRGVRDVLDYISVRAAPAAQKAEYQGFVPGVSRPPADTAASAPEK